MIKLVKEETTYKSVTKNYTIKIDGIEINFNKWWLQDEQVGNWDTDYHINTEEEYNKLTDEQVDELIDFISTLK